MQVTLVSVARKGLGCMLQKSFRSKIIIPTVIVLIVLVAILNAYLPVKFLSYSESLINEKILANTQSLKFILNDSRDNSKAAAASMALNMDAIQAIKERDRKKILQIFTPTLDLYRIHYFTICDHKGIVLARTYEPESFGDSVVNQQNVQDALDGRISSYFEEGTLIKISVRTGAPVYDTDGALLGAISAGVRFDTDSVVDDLKKLLNAEVAVFYGATRIATTIIQDRQRAVDMVLHPDIAKTVIENRQEYSGETNILGTQYKTFYMPLLNAHNHAFATFFLGTPIEELLQASNRLILDGIVIGLIGLAASIVLLSFTISSISGPLTKLANDMDEIADGNLKVTITAQSEDEVGRLGKSLQRVVNIIFKLLDDINIMIAEQKKGNTDYHLNTEAFHGDYKVLADHILELSHFGMKDQLTEMPNRRSCDNRLALEWSRAIREKQFISMLMIDVDRFKNYNDTYGHQQGDVALRSVAKVLRQAIKRAMDFAARWGGEEFIILLPDTDADGALRIAEHTREEIENTVIPSAGPGGARVTVSIGVTTLMPAACSSSIDDLVAKADEALYRAKAAGRNRVVFGDAQDAKPLRLILG